MKKISNATESAIEAAYWAFDTQRKKTGSERDAFKGQMRKALRNLQDDEDAVLMHKMVTALDFMGLPDTDSPYFEACVTHAAYRLGMLVYKRPAPTSASEGEGK